jgi:hypothetical protein
MGGEPRRGPVPAGHVALNDAELLPVGRASAGVASSESWCAGSRRDGGRGIQAGTTHLRRASPGRELMTDRQVTVYWSST